MEAIFPQSICLGYLLVDGVCPHVVGKGLVEGRVKVGDTRHTREFFFAQAHDFQGGEIVSNTMRSS